MEGAHAQPPPRRVEPAAHPSSGVVPAASGARGLELLAYALLAALLAGGQYALFGDLYLNLRDEGYLWYGVEAVLRGEVPLRDFQSYDPGRYYWCAALGRVLGHDILGVRASVAVFQGIGLFFGSCLLRRVLPARGWLVPAGLVFLLWMFPRFKLFEATLSVLAVWGMVRLLERPRPARFFTLGLIVGLAGFFGRNHGFYQGVASLALFVWMGWKLPRALDVRKLASWAGGVVVGYAPLLGMLAFVPGFASSFLEQVISVTSRGANIPEPFPWPWLWRPEGQRGFELAGSIATQIGFGLPLVVLPLGAWVLVRVRRGDGEDVRARATVVGATLVGAIYAHHYSVRSDLPHLAQSILPVLILLLALVRGPLGGRDRGAGGRRALATVLLLGLLLVHATVMALDRHPTLSYYRPGQERAELATYRADGYALRLKFAQSRLLGRLRRMLRDNVLPGEGIFIAPTHPTYYPLFGHASPTWWIYFLWPASEEEQLETIRILEEGDVQWALIVEKSFAKQEEYDFRNTNPLVWRHLIERWLPVRDFRVPRDYYFFRRP